MERRKHALYAQAVESDGREVTVKRRTLRAGLATGVTFGLLVLGFVTAPPAAAAIINVTTTFDDFNVNPGTCSLREAVQAANTDAPFGGCTAGSGDDIIQLQQATYVLDELPAGEDNNVGGDLDILADAIVNGPASGFATIDANDIDRIFDLRGGGSTGVEMRRLIIEDGTASQGGGIHGQDLIFIDGFIRNNVATGTGGGTFVARASFIRSTVVDNSASHAGGIFGVQGLELIDSRVDSNDATSDSGLGGGIWFSDGDLTATDSAVTFNTTQGEGGGILASTFDPSTVTLTRTRVANNSADDGGGGILLNGGAEGLSASITDSEIASNFGDVDNTGGGNGGGILNSGGVELTVEGTTISGNTAVDGDGIVNSGNLTLRNLTISGNGNAAGGGNGGGLWNDDDTTTSMSSVTFDANAASATGGSGGNIYNQDAGLNTENVLMGDDLGGGHCGGNDLPLQTGPNMEESGDAAPCGFQTVADVGIGPLQDNGGPELIGGSHPRTHALLAGSPALDQANSGEATDQRGVPRPQSGAWDLGSYERAFCRGVLVNEVGGPGDDSITASTEADGILTQGGDDLVHALEGNDAVCAGPGDDEVLGGFPGSTVDGADALVGGAGQDTLKGGGNADILIGGGGGDKLVGQDGADDAKGGSGGDVVKGNAGNDDLAGNGGPDKLAGGPDKDDCNGGAGADSGSGCEKKTGIP